MVLAFAKKHDVICRIFHKAVKHGNELDSWIPAYHDSHTPIMNFFVSEDHCFWYGKPLDNKGQSKAPDANNGIRQMFEKSSSSEQDEAEEDDDYDEMQEYINLFCDKETMPFFKNQIIHHLFQNGTMQMACWKRHRILRITRDHLIN